MHVAKPCYAAKALQVLLLTLGWICLFIKEFHGAVKKSLEMGRYYTSEATRNHKLQKEAINYALSKATPFIKKAGSEMLDQLSTTIRPKRNTKRTEKILIEAERYAAKV